MVATQILQSALDDLKSITKVDLCITGLEGNIEAGTFASDEFEIDDTEIKNFAQSGADSQEIKGYHFFKVLDDLTPEYIIIAKGINEDVYMIGKVAVSTIQNLVIAYKERFNKNDYIQNLLLDNLLLVDIYNSAKKLCIEIEARRVVFLIETGTEKDTEALETLKNIYAGYENDFISAIDDQNIVIVKDLTENDSGAQMQSIAQTLLDTLNSEAMSRVRISYGSVVGNIKDVSKSFKEAKMALEVGKIFYQDKSVISYSELGIGRLIYQLPVPLCRTFLTEIFSESQLDEIDEETLATINSFFDNSLNIAEASRKLFVHRNTLVYRIEKLYRSTGLDIRIFEDALIFKIALMVKEYLKHKRTVY